jgi:parallel beta-helix repeat protein
VIKNKIKNTIYIFLFSGIVFALYQNMNYIPLSFEREVTTCRLLNGTIIEDADESSPFRFSCVLNGSVTLPPKQVDSSSIFTFPIRILSSNVTLDCNGHMLTTQDYREEESHLLQGILIKSKSPAQVLENITIKNCVISNFRNGIYISIKSTRQERLDAIESKTEDSLRARSPINILISNVETFQNRNSGIYVGAYVVGSIIEKSLIKRTGGVGVYLEYGSQRNILRENSFIDNGYRSLIDPPLEKVSFREGLAVDSSAFNIIENNTFSGNAAGGIYLYKNCYEKFSENKGVPRTQASHHNIIRGNRFSNSRIGVWVAARQHRNLVAWDCGDKSPYTGENEKKYFLDYAHDNLIESNIFSSMAKFDNSIGVRIEDDNTVVRGNIFRGAFNYINVGTYLRNKELRQPVLGTVIIGNGTAVRSGFSSLVSFHDGSLPISNLNENNPKICIAPWGSAILEGASVEAYEVGAHSSVCKKQIRHCANGELSGNFKYKTCKLKPTYERFFSCFRTGSNDECTKQIACNAGDTIYAVKAACNLEWGSVAKSQVNKLSPNTLSVIRSSNRPNSICEIGLTNITAGSEMVDPILKNSVNVKCGDQEMNGGDCHIYGVATCAR